MYFSPSLIVDEHKQVFKHSNISNHQNHVSFSSLDSLQEVGLCNLDTLENKNLGIPDLHTWHLIKGVCSGFYLFVSWFIWLCFKIDLYLTSPFLSNRLFASQSSLTCQRFLKVVIQKQKSGKSGTPTLMKDLANPLS